MSDKIYYSIIIITSLISLYFFFNIRKSKLKTSEKGLYLLVITLIFMSALFLPLALDIYTWLKGETVASPVFFIALLNLLSLTLIGLMYKKILYLHDRVIRLEQETSLLEYEDKNE